MFCKSSYILLLFILTSYSCFSQSLPVGTPVAEEMWRRDQICGQHTTNVSFTIRPISVSNDSTSAAGKFFFTNSKSADIKKGFVALLPLKLTQQYNSHHPYGWNDGSMISANGYQNQFSAGIFSRIGHLQVQLYPEFVYAQNKNFSGFPSFYNDTIWKHYYYSINRIDNPEKYGNGFFVKLYPGQSFVKLKFKKLTVGVSSENLWWGPGVRNSLLMSNNAPGFYHFTFHSNEPFLTPVGSFEFQVIAGLLSKSNVLPADTSKTFAGSKLYIPKPDGQRYLNGAIITWQPKWTPGLHIGFSRVFYQYANNIPHSLNGYFPVVTKFFKSNTIDESLFGRDQLLSVFFRLIMPESKAEVYGEFGRNDHSADLQDLLLEPEHARAYLFGLRKIFPITSQRNIELFMELTQLENPSTRVLRALEGWYTHYQIRDGYTNQGQVLGAGIGQGGNLQTVGLNILNREKKIGIMVERFVHNNDFYYDAFASQGDIRRHWVDLSLNISKSWSKGRFIYDANLSYINSLNYEWQKNVDRKNIHAMLSVSYLLNQ